MKDASPCCGVLWLGPNSSPCSRCQIESECGDEFVKGRLIPMRDRLGKYATLERLSKALKTSQDVILLALAKETNILAQDQGLERKPVEKVDKPEKKKATRDRKRSWEWSPKYNATRHAREIARSPLIAALKPGMEVTTSYKGKEYKMLVVEGGYEYGSTVYPTLYATTKAAIGTRSYPKKDKDGNVLPGSKSLLGISSAVFWKLNKFLASSESKK